MIRWRNDNTQLKSVVGGRPIRGAGAPLSPTQAEALRQIVLGHGIEMAARIAGVNRGTVYRWMREDERFRRELCDAGRVACEVARLELMRVAPAALEVVANAVEDEDVSVSMAIAKAMKRLDGLARRTGNRQRNRAQRPGATTRRIWFLALMDRVAGQRLAGACDMQHGKFVALCRTKQDENRSFRSGGRPTDGNPSEGTQARRHEGTEWRRESGAGNSPSGRSWGDGQMGNECNCCDSTIFLVNAGEEEKRFDHGWHGFH